MKELQLIQSKIYEIRGQKVMLDRDLAEMYQVEVRILNQSVKRNMKRFPSDFMFQLTVDEWEIGAVSKVLFASIYLALSSVILRLEAEESPLSKGFLCR